MLWVLSFRTTFLWIPDARPRTWRAIRDAVRWPRVGVAALLCVVVALTETMTVAFTLTALVTACVLLALRDRSIVQLVAGVLVAGLVAVVVAVSLSPNLLNNLDHGSNKVVARRSIGEQEIYGLRISQMVLPSAHHRLQAARDLTARTNDTAPLSTSEEGQALGLLGTVGFVTMLGVLLLRGVPRRTRAPVTDRSQLVRHGGLLTLILILFGAASGFAVTLDLLGLTQIRAWNRVVILIAFFALVTLAVGLERGSRWLASRTPRAGLISALVLVAIVGFSLWDTTGQLPPRGDPPLVGPAKHFGAALERRLPTGAALFQLPVIPFPEWPSVNGMVDYDEFIPYLWSNHLRWSYGSIKGRPEADWQQKVSSDDPGPAVTGLVGLGFSGIVVDTAGYADGGVAVTTRLNEQLGPPAVTSPGGRWKFWDLRPYADANGLTSAELRTAARGLVGPLVDKLPVAG
jgi:phosphoglycerol transferase